MPTLDELESRLQTLLEHHLLRYLPGYKSEDRVFQHLAAAMHNGLRDEQGRIIAPDVFIIIAHPITLSRWHSESRLVAEMAEALRTTGIEAGYQFLVNPTVTTAADTDMAVEETRIIASFSSEGIPETQAVQVDKSGEAEADPVPANAFLILGGTKIFPLNRPVMNIGRRLDNQIVIDDPRVSRTHVQLRVARGRFVLFDLESSGGTFINGQRIHQSILYPGDVISLAGVNLIFGQDLPNGRNPDRVKTSPAPAISADRPTAILTNPEELEKLKLRKK